MHLFSDVLERCFSLEEPTVNKHYFTMNFVFRSYPSHPWFADWTLEPRGCKASFRQTGAASFFRTLDVVGRFGPNTDSPSWAAQVPVPQNSRINMLFNGLCAYVDKKKSRVGAEVITPEPGVLWGRTLGLPAPVLASEFAIAERDDYQWMEGDDGSVLLKVRGDFFCLVTKSRVQSDAIRVADGYLEQEIEATLKEEYARRSGAENLFEEMAHHDALAVISAESVMKSLRPAEGKIPLAWCQSAASDAPGLDVNELHPLALAWSLMDPQVAEELVLSVLKAQSNSGAIPTRLAPHGPGSIMEAPKPFLTKTTEAVWKVRQNEEFLTAALPLLRRHIQWLLHHFDPKRRGLHVWKNQGEPIIPSMFQTDRATVDLSVMLISEIDALNRLSAQSQLDAPDAELFTTERETLERNILEVFWNPTERSFCNAVLRDEPGILNGFSTFTPLLWKKLPHDHREAILDHVQQSGALPGGVSVLSWRKSAMDDDSFPLNQQLFVFQALQTAAPHGQLLNDFSRVTLQGFVEWHTLALQKENRLRVHSVMGAFIMNVQAIRQYRYHAQSGVPKKMFRFFRKHRADRFDLAVAAATIFAVISVRLIYNVLEAPPPLALLEAQMNTAYANRNSSETINNCMAILQYYPEDADGALQLAANLSMTGGDFVRAADLYEKVRDRNPDSPGPMIALGMAYQLQGRVDLAEENYHEFCYIFEEIFPELVEQVNTYRYLAREGLKTPPKWRKIYRYQLMHEL